MEYIANPCKASSLPYWKHKITNIPENMVITFEDIDGSDYSRVDYFFKLVHYLDYISSNKSFEVQEINKNDYNELIEMINACYEEENVSISNTMLNEMINSKVYDSSLWIKIVDHGRIIASGIADFDPEIKEGILEWIQVLPEYQSKGYGKVIVNELLRRLKAKATSVIVSGNLNNHSNPLRLYESCGFTNKVIWKICYKK